jgi:metabolite-proton symporter
MTTRTSDPTATRRIALASLIGTAVEWYDFFIYGAAAALVFGPRFFPGFSPVAGTLAAFSTLAVGFLARPLGGIVMGHFGDRVGRKSVLVLSLLIMGGATVLMSVLPTFDTIGAWAPILLVLLRFMQGIGVGGEWGGAVLMAVEHAPERKRAFYGSFPAIGVPVGLILANLVFLVVSATLTPEQFTSWGWRVPFLLSIVLVGTGLFVRLRITESPVFTEVNREHATVRLPIVQVLRRNPWLVVLATLTVLGQNGIGYLVNTYLLNYGTTVLGLSRGFILTLVLISSAVWLMLLALFAGLSDRLGRRPVLIGSMVAMLAWSAVFFALINTKQPALMLIALIVMAVTFAAVGGPLSAYLAELFDAEVRYTGASLAYQLGSILGGGIAPFIATALFAATGSSTAITIYMCAICAVSLAAIIAIGETQHLNLGLRRTAHRDPTTAPTSSTG